MDHVELAARCGEESWHVERAKTHTARSKPGARSAGFVRSWAASPYDVLNICCAKAEGVEGSSTYCSLEEVEILQRYVQEEALVV